MKRKLLSSLLFLTTVVPLKGYTQGQYAESKRVVLKQLPDAVSPSRFQKQFGIGGTMIPVYGAWYLGREGGYYGGVQLDFLGRVHPQLTLEGSVGIIAAARSLIEFPISLGMRVYLRALPTRIDRIYLMPYLTVGFQVGIPLDRSRYFYIDGFGGSYPQVYSPAAALYIGANLGAGLEIRFKRHFAMNVDLRFTGDGAVDIYQYERNIYPRLGLRLGIGVAGYL